MNWTFEQAQAIELRDKNILVAAAAGSGKTAVLVERIKRLILEDKCPIDRMLIVTFTNAAAAEMKEKIRRAINETIRELAEQAEAEEENGEAGTAAADLVFLKQQLNLLPQAQISTFHSFALELIRKYFYIIDVEPNFKICDDAQQVILRANAMDQLLEECFESDDEDFLHFLSCYSGDRNENKFRELIDKVYNTIQALPEPEAWLREKVDMLASASDESLEPLIKVLDDIAEETIARGAAIIGRNKEKAEEYGLDKAAALAEDDLVQLDALRQHFGDFEQLREALGSFKLGTQRKTFYCAEAQNPLKEAPQLTPEEGEAMNNAAKANRELVKKQIKELKEDYFAGGRDVLAAEMALTHKDAVMTEKLVNRYSQLYKEEKSKRGLVDFSDIEHYAYEILKDEEVSRFCREKYIHVFVDEYQDSNVMQEALLARICRKNNLFLVGDVKQSIYKFRLAEPEIFQRRYREYGSCGESGDSVKIDLNQNFRSKAPIIDFVNEVFDYIMDDYDDAAALHMGDAFGDHYYHEPMLYLMAAPWDDDESIDDELKNMMKAEKEALAAVKLIRESLGQPIFDSKAQTMRALELKDIVILMRGIRNYGDVFYNVLMENGITAYVDDNDGYFDTMEINTFLSLLMILDNEKQDVPLLTVLRSEIFGFTIGELAEIRIACKEGSYFEAFMNYADCGPDALLAEKSKAAAETLAQWQEMAVFMPLEELVWKLMLDTGFYLAMGAMPGGQQRQANLRALTDRALVYRKGQSGSLYGFIRYIEAVKEKKIASGQVKLAGEGDELVKIMTIHKSKGLEFPMVILPGFCRRLNYTTMGKSLAIHKDLGIGFPIINKKESWYRTTQLQKLIKEKIHREEEEEEKRVLYVALTRPKDRLAILGICEDVQKELDKVGMKASKGESYFYMTGNRICTRMNRYEIIEDSDLLRLATHHQRRPDKVIQLLDGERCHASEESLKQQVKRQLEFEYPDARQLQIKSKYSVSELNAVSQPVESLAEPESFKNRGTFTAAQKGTIYHILLEHLNFRSAWAGGDTAQGLCEVEMTRKWLAENQFLTEEEAGIIDTSVIMKLVESDLGYRLAQAESEGLLKKECPFNLKMDYDPDGSGNPSEVIVQGVIDCWFEEADGLVLVDYKTSKIRSSGGQDMSEASAAREKKRIAERYRTQIEIYRRALEVTTGKSVKEAYIYLTDCGEVVEL